jgi:hypothetical protein
MSLTSDYKRGHRHNGFDRAAFAATLRKSRAMARMVPGGLKYFVDAYRRHRPKPWRDKVAA